jgi:hypothetical protein
MYEMHPLCPLNLGVTDTWPEPTVTWSHRIVRCAKRTKGSTVGFTTSGKKSGTVHVRWCTRLSGAPPDIRQELPTKWSSNGCSCLEAIKGTSKRMEHYTKPPFNILRRLDSATMQSDHHV